MDNEKDVKHENSNEQKKSEIKKGLLRAIFMILGVGVVDFISIFVTGEVFFKTTIGIGIGVTLAFLVSIIKQKNKHFIRIPHCASFTLC